MRMLSSNLSELPSRRTTSTRSLEPSQDVDALSVVTPAASRLVDCVTLANAGLRLRHARTGLQKALYVARVFRKRRGNGRLGLSALPIKHRQKIRTVRVADHAGLFGAAELAPDPVGAGALNRRRALKPTRPDRHRLRAQGAKQRYAGIRENGLRAGPVERHVHPRLAVVPFVVDGSRPLPRPRACDGGLAARRGRRDARPQAVVVPGAQGIAVMGEPHVAMRRAP